MPNDKQLSTRHYVRGIKSIENATHDAIEWWRKRLTIAFIAAAPVLSLFGFAAINHAEASKGFQYAIGIVILGMAGIGYRIGKLLGDSRLCALTNASLQQLDDYISDKPVNDEVERLFRQACDQTVNAALKGLWRSLPLKFEHIEPLVPPYLVTAVKAALEHDQADDQPPQQSIDDDDSSKEDTDDEQRRKPR